MAEAQQEYLRLSALYFILQRLQVDHVEPAADDALGPPNIKTMLPHYEGMSSDTCHFAETGSADQLSRAKLGSCPGDAHVFSLAATHAVVHEG